MPILEFQRPDKVTMIESDDQRGTFEFRPLEPGYGITIGNALRRILLSSLEGHAITSLRIDGVDHEFTTIKGVIEDVTEIVLNLKQVRFRRQLEDVSTEKVELHHQRQGQLHRRRHRQAHHRLPGVEPGTGDLPHGGQREAQRGAHHRQGPRLRARR